MKIKKPKLLKNLTWPQAKARFPLMKPYGDADKDGLKNFRDCKPFDIKRKGEEHDEENDSEKTHKCLANMEEHKLKDCPSLQGFKKVY